MGKTDVLREINVNVDSGLERMLGKEELYLKLLRSFVSGNYIETLRAELSKSKADASNIGEARKAAHAIKGVAANLELTDILELSKSMEASLKSNELGIALEQFPNLEEKYEVLVQTMAKIE